MMVHSPYDGALTLKDIECKVYRSLLQEALDTKRLPLELKAKLQEAFDDMNELRGITTQKEQVNG